MPASTTPRRPSCTVRQPSSRALCRSRRASPSVPIQIPMVSPERWFDRATRIVLIWLLSAYLCITLRSWFETSQSLEQMARILERLDVLR